MLLNLLSWIAENYLEFIAAVSGVAGVYLTSRQIIWCWPVAIVNVVLSMYIFFIEKLYQDTILQVFYLIMAFYGWYNWMYGGKSKDDLKVSRMKWNAIVLMLGTGTALLFGFGYFFHTYTDASIPYWDAATTVWGIIGTYLMAKKKIENWIIWLAVDILCVGIYYYKGLYGFVGLYFIFTILAIYGYIQWKKDLNIKNL